MIETRATRPAVVVAVMLAATVATGTLVLADVDGPVRAAMALLFLLVAPGLTLSLLMGPMSGAARALVTVLGSVAVLTSTALALEAVGDFSSDAGFLVTAGVVILASVPAWRSGEPARRTT